MNSSISSSSESLLSSGWGRTWLLAAAAMLLFVCGWETYVRMHGTQAFQVENSAELWAQERARASALGSQAVVLVGASRMQMDIDIETMQRISHKTPVQLAISASPFMPVLRDLADDDRVSGTILVSLTMQDLVSQTSQSAAEQWVQSYRLARARGSASFYEPAEETLHQTVHKTFVSLSLGARPQNLLFGSRLGYVRTLPNRMQLADYESTDRAAAYRERVRRYIASGGEPVRQTVADFDARIAALNDVVERIRSHGGDVVLIRFPSTRRIWEIEQIRYPRDAYWDALAEHTTARTIHFADHPELMAFDLPDGVHLDYRDAPSFTAALSRLIWNAADPPPGTQLLR